MRPFSRQPKLLDQAALWDYALKTLGARALSISELRQRLQRRAEPSVDVEATVAKLREYGYLNDEQFADAYANARLQNQGLGKARVLRDLRQRRVAPSVAERAVRQTFSEVDETALIQQYLQRKFRNMDLHEHLSDPRHLAAAYRRLRYAGFASGNAIRVLKQYADEADTLEGMEE